MRRILIIASFISISLCVFAQKYDFDKITLAPNIESTQVLDANANRIMRDKLSQLALASGFTSKGIDDRFVITSHATELESVVMPSTPTKYVVRLLVTIYVGDGEVGTLFSSYTSEAKGIGTTQDEAYANAYKRIKTRSPELIASIKQGGMKIIDFYNANYSSIIANAQAIAKQGKYDEAIYNLFTIPEACKGYEQAQQLAGKLAFQAAEQYNDQIITRARAAWAASPNEQGADQAQRILAEMSNPSSNSIAKAQKLAKEMATRLQNVEDQRLRLERLQAQYDHAERMAEIKEDARTERTRINANASVQRTQIRANARQNVAAINAARDIAVSYYNSRPRRVYHYHWW